jgi:hypothetical protein
VPPEPRATRNRCYRCPLRALRGACHLCKRTARTSPAAEGPATTGRALRASLSLIPPLLGGRRGRDEPGARINPNRMGLEEQTEAHALLAKAANHPDWRVASHALDELMRRLLVLHRLLEAEERLASPGASKR